MATDRPTTGQRPLTYGGLLMPQQKLSAWWQPEKYTERLPRLRQRQAIMQATRQWFAGQDFLEVETPALQVCPGMEVHLHAIAARWQGPQPHLQQQFYLHTSPELTMKKLLVAGLPKIFQLARVWRDREQSGRHLPEFVMLEWYRALADYTMLMDDCVALIRATAAAIGVREISRQQMACDLFTPWQVLSVPAAFAEYTGIDLLATINDPERPSAAALAAAASKIGVRVADDDSWDDIFFRVMLERIEPKLGVGQPTFLTDYPIHMAALARPKPSDPRLAERFELYLCGVELANAFGELTDANQQRARFVAEQADKAAFYGETYPIDEDFLAALAAGMPPAAGIALGFDRLVMLLTGATTIDDIVWAPVIPPEIN